MPDDKIPIFVYHIYPYAYVLAVAIFYNLRSNLLP